MVLIVDDKSTDPEAFTFDQDDYYQDEFVGIVDEDKTL